MKKYYEPYGIKPPKKDATNDEIWTYAQTFKGYSWTTDMMEGGKIDSLLSEESIKWLDLHAKGWRDGDSIVPIACCIASGKHTDDCSIEELRVGLYCEARAKHWANDDSVYDDTVYARVIVDAIRIKSE